MQLARSQRQRGQCNQARRSFEDIELKPIYGLIYKIILQLGEREKEKDGNLVCIHPTEADSWEDQLCTD